MKAKLKRCEKAFEYNQKYGGPKEQFAFGDKMARKYIGSRIYARGFYAGVHSRLTEKKLVEALERMKQAMKEISIHAHMATPLEEIERMADEALKEAWEE